MFSRFLTGLLVRLLEGSLKVDYKQIDRKAYEDFMFASFDSKGWRSYFAYEDLKILKEMSQGKGPWEYALLVGRRLQLLYLFDEMKKVVEHRKSAEEKKAAAARAEGK